MSDAHDSSNARRNSTSSSSNEFEQVFERYTYEDYEMQFKFLLNVMKEITKRTAFNIPTFAEAAKENQVELRQIGNPPDSEGQGWLQVFGSTLNKISHELISKTKTDDEEEKASRILKAVANYSMKAKVVMVLAAFSVKYGKVCLAAGLYPLNPVARAVVSLRRQHSVLERPEYLTQWHNKVAEIIKKMLDLTEQRILTASQNDAQAVQLIIQCAIVCSAQMMAILMPDGHIRGAHEKLPEPYRWKLCVLNNALDNMLEGGRKVYQTLTEIAEELDSTKPSVEKATAATKKEKNQPKSKGRSSNKVKPANICC